MMKIQALLDAIEGCTVRGPVTEDIRALAYDSRRVQAGSLFVALPGQRTNGVQYIEDAVQRGAQAVVTEEVVAAPRNVACVRVKDARRALAQIACAFYGFPSSHMTVAGITGTNGKTTVSYMLRDMLRAADRAPGMIGTVVYEMGQRVIPASRTTPEAPDLQDMLAQMRRAGNQSAVMEVSSHALIQKRVWGVDFDVAVFTNLTHDHLDYHGSMEAYFDAKTLLFQELGRREKPGVAVINLDDPWGRRLAKRPGKWSRMITFGEHSAADVRAENVQLGKDGTPFELRTPEGSGPVRLPLLGPFNISNALAAAGAALALGVSREICVSVLEHFTAAPGRLEPVPYRSGIRVFVDYAHTDDALYRVLSAVRATGPGRVILVFGCGGNRDRAKRPRMGAVAAKQADMTILTNDNPRDEEPQSILEEIARGFDSRARFDTIPDREQAIATALARAQPGDIVLIAGKGHENYQECHRTVLPFDDREVVRRYAAKQRR